MNLDHLLDHPLTTPLPLLLHHIPLALNPYTIDYPRVKRDDFGQLRVS